VISTADMLQTRGVIQLYAPLYPGCTPKPTLAALKMVLTASAISGPIPELVSDVTPCEAKPPTVSWNKGSGVESLRESAGFHTLLEMHTHPIQASC
jgi:hypothetical protein